MLVTVREREKEMRDPTHALSSRLQKAALLQQSSHLLIFTLARFPFQTQVPELVTIVDAILIHLEGLLQIGENGCHCLEVVWLRLPSLDVLDDFRRFLTFAEIDHVSVKLVFGAVVDEGQCGQIYT